MPLFLLLFLFLCSFTVSSSSTEPRSNSPVTRSYSPGPLSPRSVDSQQDATSILITRVFLLFFAFFMLVFLLVSLIIGHFTWFADLREKLEVEHKLRLAQESARLREEQRVESCPPPSSNPFAEWAESSSPNSSVEFEDAECDPELCVPPHHSILCPNNRMIPLLNEPLRMESLNSISILSLARPVPQTACSSRSSALPVIERSMTPSQSPNPGLQNFAKNSRFVERDLESGRPVRSSSASPFSSTTGTATNPRSVLDISKLDMI